MNHLINQNWIFAVNNDCQFQGIGNTGVSLFRGDPIKSLTREICQNSIDARLDQSKPVKVEFKTFDIKTSDFPGIDTLSENIENIYKYAKNSELKKAEKILGGMIPILKKDHMKILRISDYNTKGLEGADKAKTDFKSPWNRLVRSEGSSDKQEGSMGSFGSGHLAVYATSAISTVLYSTMDCSNNKVEASEGVARIMGHIDALGNQHSDVGYLGNAGTSLPVLHQFEIDPNFKRNEPGTDIYSAAFKFSGNQWKDDLIAAVLDGFFYAIEADNLIVNAEGVEISSRTIKSLMETHRESIDQKTRDYYSILSDKDVKFEKIKLIDSEDVEIKLKIGEDLCKRVAIIRWPGMKIFDKGNISSTVPFAGVCIIKGKTISELFKGLENIQHTKWELARYEDEPELKKRAAKKEKELYKAIREIFRNKLGDTATESIDPDIGDCLPDPFAENENEKQSLTDETAEVSIKKADIPSILGGESENDGVGGTKVPPTPNPNPEPHPPYPGPVPPIPGPEPGPNPDPNPSNDEGKKSKDKVKSLRAKVRPIGEGDGTGRYTIVITPQKDIKDGYAQISLAAETGKYDAQIDYAKINNKKVKISGNKVFLPDSIAGSKIRIEVQIRHKEMRSLEVRIYGK